MKIQSYSDIITNSSSEIFIMTYDDAKYIADKFDNNECISVECMYWDWFVNNPTEWDTIAEILNVYFDDDIYYGDKEKEKEFLNKIKPLYMEKFSDGEYAMIDIEDHFDGCDEAYDIAEDYCIWSESRH